MRIAESKLRRLIKKYLILELKPGKKRGYFAGTDTYKDVSGFKPAKTGEEKWEEPKEKPVGGSVISILDDFLYSYGLTYTGIKKYVNNKDLPLPIRMFAKFLIKDKTVLTESFLTKKEVDFLRELIIKRYDALGIDYDGESVPGSIAFNYNDYYNEINVKGPKFWSANPMVDIFKDTHDGYIQSIGRSLGQFHIQDHGDHWIIEEPYDFDTYKKNAKGIDATIRKSNEEQKMPTSAFIPVAIMATVMFTLSGKGLYGGIRHISGSFQEAGITGFNVKIRIDK